MAAHSDNVTTATTRASAQETPAPNNALLPLTLVDYAESREVWRQLASTTKILGELSVAGQLIPNQSLLIRAALLQEAKLSSEIENIVTTNDALYQQFGKSAEPADAAVKEVIRYEEALWFGFNAIQKGAKISPELMVQIGRIVKDQNLSVRKKPGVIISNKRTGEIVYVPPVGEKLINELLQNIADFLVLDSETHPLIKLAMAHYQFEAVHPFPDGNGRTGRILNILYLIQSSQLELPILYLSGYLIENRAEYYSHLRTVTENNQWNDWILFMLTAIERTAIEARDLIFATRDLLQGAIETARNEMSKGYSKELIEIIFRKPYTRISDVMESMNLSRDASSDYLAILADIGLLERHPVGREVLYLNRPLLLALTEGKT